MYVGLEGTRVEKAGGGEFTAWCVAVCMLMAVLHARGLLVRDWEV